MKTELLITMFMLLGITISVNAQQVEKDGIYYTINGETATVTGCISGTKHAKIAESVEHESKTYPVIGIEGWALAGEDFATVSIPSSITYIGASAFRQCKALGQLTFPSETPYQLTIGDVAFNYCKSLKSIVFPEGTLSIGASSFGDCSDLEQVTFPSSLNSLGESAFSATKLESVTIPKGTTSIGSGAFAGCPLKAIEVSPENNTYSSLDNILFDKDQKTIIIYPYLKAGIEYVIPNTVDSISDYCFNNCSTLTSITLPEGLKKIGQEAFSSSGLTSMAFPESISFIGDYAFQECKNLVSITIPSNITSIGEYVFFNCKSLTSVTLPQGLKSIRYCAFNSCSNLTSIELPEGLTTIEGSAFSKTGLVSVSIPNSVNSLGGDVFYKCNSLSSVKLSNSVTSIEGNTFRGTSLISITIPEGVESIGEGAFAQCSKLISINIPSTANYIGIEAFLDCEKLADIFIWAEVPPAIENNTFSKYSATLHVPAGCKKAYEEDDKWYKFTNLVEDAVSVDKETAEATINYIDGTLFLPKGILSTVYIYTCDGKYIASYYVAGETCDLSSLAKGMYVVKVMSGNRMNSVKIIR